MTRPAARHGRDGSTKRPWTARGDWQPAPHGPWPRPKQVRRHQAFPWKRGCAPSGGVSRDYGHRQHERRRAGVFGKAPAVFRCVARRLTRRARPFRAGPAPGPRIPSRPLYVYRVGTALIPWVTKKADQEHAAADGQPPPVRGICGAPYPDERETTRCRANRRWRWRTRRWTAANKLEPGGRSSTSLDVNGTRRRMRRTMKPLARLKSSTARQQRLGDEAANEAAADPPGHGKGRQCTQYDHERDEAAEPQGPNNMPSAIIEARWATAPAATPRRTEQDDDDGPAAEAAQIVDGLLRLPPRAKTGPHVSPRVGRGAQEKEAEKAARSEAMVTAQRVVRERGTVWPAPAEPFRSGPAALPELGLLVPEWRSLGLARRRRVPLPSLDGLGLPAPRYRGPGSRRALARNSVSGGCRLGLSSGRGSKAQSEPARFRFPVRAVTARAELSRLISRDRLPFNRSQ